MLLAFPTQLIPNYTGLQERQLVCSFNRLDEPFNRFFTAFLRGCGFAPRGRAALHGV
jgi:hypothetical protein